MPWLLWLVLFSFPPLGLGISPKMNTEIAYHGKPFDHGNSNETESITSHSYVTIAKCSRDEPVMFPVSGGSGRGVIIVPKREFKFGNLSLVVVVDAPNQNDNGILVLSPGGPEENALGTESSTVLIEHLGYHFEFREIPATSGSTARFTCLQRKPKDVIIIVRDDSNVVVNARDAFDGLGRQRLELVDGVQSKVTLHGQSHMKGVAFEDASNGTVHIRHGQQKQQGVLVMVHFQVHSPDGKLVHRTLLTQTRKQPEPVKFFSVFKTDVNSDGDLVVTFSSIGEPNQPFKLHARFGIQVNGSKKRNITRIRECVDVSAIVEDNTLVVHTEWLRRCIKQVGLTRQIDGWDVVIMNATMTDPEDGYRVRGRLAEAAETAIHELPSHKRKKIAAAPTLQNITTAMWQGRTPPELARRAKLFRSLSVAQQKQQFKKILVHGYCSKAVFPTSQFKNATTFTDRADPQAWSHDTFARKLYNFTKSLTGCGCIAHSQGGAACLHLLAHYHTCLNYNFGSWILRKGRKIQSVGTPYQGTHLAGSAAALTQVFGVGCGIVHDLGYSGAATWLKGISWTYRIQVYYYTTAYKLRPQTATDYCSRVTHLLLGDPNDGVTERDKGQLPRGINMGTKEGWCHCGGMKATAQFLDSSRNAIMNANSVVK